MGSDRDHQTSGSANAKVTEEIDKSGVEAWPLTLSPFGVDRTDTCRRRSEVDT